MGTLLTAEVQAQIDTLSPRLASVLRAILRSSGRLTRASVAAGYNPTHFASTISRVLGMVGDDSPLGVALNARREHLQPEDLVRCMACDLRGHATGSDRCPGPLRLEDFTRRAAE